MWLAPAVVAVVTVVAFLPAIAAPFVAWDDPTNFLQNPHYRGLGPDNLRWMWTTTLLGHYVPVTWMTLGLDYLLWGMDPMGYHAVNVALHAVNAVLLYVVARRLLAVAGLHDGASGPSLTLAAALAALLFAVHPLRVESVAWVTERRDIVSLLFTLVTVMLFLRASAEPTRFRRWYGLSLVTFACALLSKATAVTLPAALLVLSAYPLRRIGGAAGWWSASARRALLEVAPFVVLAAIAGLASVLVLRPGAQLPLPGKLVVSAYSFAFYLGKTIAPFDLAPLYETPARIDPFAPRFLVGYVVTLLVAIAAWALRRRWTAVTAGLVAFAALIFPFLGIVQNGPHLAADRYTYHAAPALALLAAGAFALPARRAVVAATGGTIVLVFAVLTWRQTLVWQSSEALWARVLERDPTSYVANNNMGVLVAERGRSSEAIEYYRRSLRTRPSYADAHNNLGYELAQLDRLDEAIAEYRAALGAKPAYADAEVNLGNALVRSRRFDEAIDHYESAARLDPERAVTHFNWAVALAEKGDLSAAVQHLTTALDIDPELDDARRLLADVRDELRRGAVQRRP